MTIILVRMPERTRFEIVYSVAVLGHLEGVPRRHHSLLRRELEQQPALRAHGAHTRTGSRFVAPMRSERSGRLRCGPEGRYRVFYEVRADERRVWVLALGVKDRNRLLIGNQEIQL